VSFDCNVELPVSFHSIPRWSYPDADVYWFHEYLVVLQDDVEYNAIITGAVSKAESYIGNSRLSHDGVRLIVISPRRVAFVELSCEVVQASRSLILLSNYSATRCSPGFRALARVLTSNCCKKPRAHREKWPVNMPPEIVRMILHELEPRDAVAFRRHASQLSNVTTLQNPSSRSLKCKASSLLYLAAVSALGWRRMVFGVLNAMPGNILDVSVRKFILPAISTFVRAARKGPVWYLIPAG
jgi:hypothetical protein